MNHRTTPQPPPHRIPHTRPMASIHRRTQLTTSRGRIPTLITARRHLLELITPATLPRNPHILTLNRHRIHTDVPHNQVNTLLLHSPVSLKLHLGIITHLMDVNTLYRNSSSSSNNRRHSVEEVIEAGVKTSPIDFFFPFSIVRGRCHCPEVDFKAARYTHLFLRPFTVPGDTHNCLHQPDMDFQSFHCLILLASIAKMRLFPQDPWRT